MHRWSSIRMRAGAVLVAASTLCCGGRAERNAATSSSGGASQVPSPPGVSTAPPFLSPGPVPEQRPRWFLYATPAASGYPEATLVRFDDVRAPRATALGGTGQWLRRSAWSEDGTRLLYQLDDYELGTATGGGGTSLWFVDVAAETEPVRIDRDMRFPYVSDLRWAGNAGAFLEVEGAFPGSNVRAGYYWFDPATLELRVLRSLQPERNASRYAVSAEGTVFGSGSSAGCGFQFLSSALAEPIRLETRACSDGVPSWAANRRFFALSALEGTSIYELRDGVPEPLVFPELELAEPLIDGEGQPARAQFQWAERGSRFVSLRPAGQRPSRDDDNPTEIVLGDAETGVVVTYTDPLRATYARWLGDRVLALTSSDEHRLFWLPELAAAPQLEPETLRYYQAEYSEKDDTLLFSVLDGTTDVIYQMDSSSQRRTVADAGELLLGGFGFSPDRDWLVFDTRHPEPDGVTERNLLRRATLQTLALDRHPKLKGHTEWAQFTPDGAGILCDTHHTREDGTLTQEVYYISLEGLGDAYSIYAAPGDNGNHPFELPSTWPAP